jgi:hypothetical protein
MISKGAQIRAARALLNWTQKDLALASTLHYRSIQYWELQTDIKHGGYREPVGVRHIREALERHGVQAFTRPTVGVAFSVKPDKRKP